jgi:predicted transcriptional regulator
MDRANEFVELYNQLDAFLSKLVDANERKAFSQLLDQASRRNAAVRKHVGVLKDYADFRNVLIHHRAYPRDTIAEPTEQALARFRRVIEDIKSPPRLIPKFQRDIRCFSPDDPLLEALVQMRENDYSQVVVSKDCQLALLTSEGIGQWLGRQADADIISVREASVGDALEHDDPRAFRVMSRDKSVYDATAAFSELTDSRLFAIVVTQSGRLDQQPLGIVTPWDIFHELNRPGFDGDSDH